MTVQWGPPESYDGTLVSYHLLFTETSEYSVYTYIIYIYSSSYMYSIHVYTVWYMYTELDMYCVAETLQWNYVLHFHEIKFALTRNK